VNYKWNSIGGIQGWWETEEEARAANPGKRLERLTLGQKGGAWIILARHEYRYFGIGLVNFCEVSTWSHLVSSEKNPRRSKVTWTKQAVSAESSVSEAKAKSLVHKKLKELRGGFDAAVFVGGQLIGVGSVSWKQWGER